MDRIPSDPATLEENCHPRTFKWMPEAAIDAASSLIPLSRDLEIRGKCGEESD